MSGKNRYGGAESALLRHETYARGHARMTLAVLVMACVTLCALVMAWLAHSAKPEPRYFAARENGSLIPLVPVDQPYLSDGQITNFAVEAVTRALTIDFANWRSDLSEASEYFERPRGWENFLTAIESSGMLDYIKNRRLVASIVANGAVIVRSGPGEGGRFTWTVQIPITVTYESSSEISRDSLLAEMLVSRLPTSVSSRGVAISRIIVRPGR